MALIHNGNYYFLIFQVPQVFINGNCVGGGSDVKALHASGKLEPMLIG